MDSWRATLRDYMLPRLGDMPVDAITGKDVMAVLQPIWTSKRETARRVRSRIGAVMKWAVAQGHRPDNPAGGALAAALPNVAARRQHLKAMPHAEVGAALKRMRATDAYRGTVLALEFLVLTAVRSGEVRKAAWDDIDIDAAVWTIPAGRMKAGREHRVPLADRTLAVLDEARRELRHGDGVVFPSPAGGIERNGTMSDLMRELKIDAVPHGFRSSFRDWAAECTEAPREVCELAWRTSTTTAPRPPTGAATCSSAAGRSCSSGPTTSPWPRETRSTAASSNPLPAPCRPSGCSDGN